ncbi:MAG: hypothetical protein J4F31_07860 [Flavobacteriales bacterium]|nr:hypothetical protein [Flavobacteriales bacterium]
MRGSFFGLMLVLVLLLAPTESSAQYRNSVGVRLGVTNGINYKAFLKPRQALEVSVTTSWNGVIMTGLWEWHTDFTKPLQISTGNFEGYLSLGTHYGAYGAESPLYEGTGGGFDAGMGFEYRFDQIPFSLGVDYHFMADLQLSGGSTSPNLLADLGLNLRYLFR